jgi:hypothetical protein
MRKLGRPHSSEVVRFLRLKRPATRCTAVYSRVVTNPLPALRWCPGQVAILE